MTTNNVHNTTIPLASNSNLRLTAELDQDSEQAHPAVAKTVPYCAKPDGLYHTTKDGDVRLSNFTAVITADLIQTDGTHRERQYKIRARIGNEQRCFSVPAERFDRLSWVAAELGAAAIIEPGAKKHLPHAIRVVSGSIAQCEIRQHTGWIRDADGGWVYLTAGKPIGVSGQTPAEVALPDELKRVQLPLPRSKAEVRKTVLASLELLDLAPDRVMVPLLGAVYRSVLGPADMAVHLSGQTGTFKSSIASLCQQHFGSDYDVTRLPGSWSSTANALGHLLYQGKDMLVVVDDYVPGEDEAERKAQQLFRAQGNGLGRGRLMGNGQLMSAHPPRGLILSTGEDLPPGQSICARLVGVDVAPGDVDQDALSVAQTRAANGWYARAMAGYIDWLAPRYDEIQHHMNAELSSLRQKYDQHDQHRRTATNIAQLALGWKLWLDAVADMKILPPKAVKRLRIRCTNALRQVASIQTERQRPDDQVERFFDLLRTAFANGLGHLRNQRCSEPRFLARGWRQCKTSFDKKAPQGPIVGWVRMERFDETNEIYLDPEVAYKIAQKAAGSAEGRLKVGPRALWKMLDERNHLLSTEKAAGRGRMVRVMIGGSRRAVLHISATTLFGTDE